MPLVDDAWRGKLDARLLDKRLALVIWTTTPWTLAGQPRGRRAPATFTYLAFPNPRDPAEYLIVARDLAESVVAAIGGGDLSRAIEIWADEMQALEGARYQHPFITTDSGAHPEDVFRLWFADYVTSDAGTGLVHTAPGHGADDFKTGKTHGLPAYAPLDDAGRYVAGVRIESGRRARRADHRRGEPAHRRAPGQDRLPAQPADRSRAPPVRALLAVQEADRVSRDAAVVHRDGP